MSIAEPILAGSTPEWAHRPELRPVASEPPALARSESRTRAFTSSVVWALIGFAVAAGVVPDLARLLPAERQGRGVDDLHHRPVAHRAQHGRGRGGDSRRPPAR